MTITNLTSALRSPHSTLARYLSARYPNLAAIQREFRLSAADFVAPHDPDDHGLVAEAFHRLVGLRAGDRRVPSMAPGVYHLVDAALRPDAAVEDLCRFALVAEMSARGWLDHLSAYQVDSLVTGGQVDELLRLDALAATRLYPSLLRRANRVTTEPQWDDSCGIAATPDLVVDRCLVEIKTINALTLRKRDVHQMIGYALLDVFDDWGLEEVAIYSARHGIFRRWWFEDLLARLAGESVDVATERGRLYQALAW